jgi:hypothetical protein
MALLTPVAVQAENSRNVPLDKTMRDIRIWLDGERIELVQFKTVVGRAGLGFEISFRYEREAECFQERFESLLAWCVAQGVGAERRRSAPEGGRAPAAG